MSYHSQIASLILMRFKVCLPPKRHVIMLWLIKSLIVLILQRLEQWVYRIWLFFRSQHCLASFWRQTSYPMRLRCPIYLLQFCTPALFSHSVQMCDPACVHHISFLQMRICSWDEVLPSQFLRTTKIQYQYNATKLVYAHCPYYNVCTSFAIYSDW